MLSSISRLGERARNNRWVVTVGVYTAASAAVGAAAGAVLGGIGSLLSLTAVQRAGALAVIAALAVLADLGLLPIPTIRRQVDEDWLHRYRGWVYGAGFGGQLGLGVVTIVTTATIYLTLAGELLSARPMTGVLIGGAFGLVRALPLLVAGRARTHGELVARHRRILALAPGATVATVGVTGAAAVLLAVVAVLAGTGRLA